MFHIRMRVGKRRKGDFSFLIKSKPKVIEFGAFPLPSPRRRSRCFCTTPSIYSPKSRTRSSPTLAFTTDTLKSTAPQPHPASGPPRPPCPCPWPLAAQPASWTPLRASCARCRPAWLRGLFAASPAQPVAPPGFCPCSAG
jgi:hypothetical protein